MVSWTETLAVVCELLVLSVPDFGIVEVMGTVLVVIGAAVVIPSVAGVFFPLSGLTTTIGFGPTSSF